MNVLEYLNRDEQHVYLLKDISCEARYSTKCHILRGFMVTYLYIGIEKLQKSISTTLSDEPNEIIYCRLPGVTFLFLFFFFHETLLFHHQSLRIRVQHV